MITQNFMTNLSNTIESFRKQKTYFGNNLKFFQSMWIIQGFLKIDVYNKYLNLSIAVD